MTIPPSLRTWKKVLSLGFPAAACSAGCSEVACSIGTGDSCACESRTNGTNPSRTARATTRITPAADLELTIDVFIFWFGFWFLEEIFPRGLFFLFFGLFGSLGLLRAARWIGGLFGFELYRGGCCEQLVNVHRFLLRPVVF